MEKITAQINANPLLRYISKQTHIAPLYIALGALGLAFVVIQKTPMGPLFSNTFLAAVVLREVLLSLRSPSPRSAEMRKHVIVLSFYVLLFLVESVGLGSIVPLFGMLKLGFVLWASLSIENAESVYASVLSKVPREYLEGSGQIEQAARDAARATANAMKSTARTVEEEVKKTVETSKNK